MGELAVPEEQPGGEAAAAWAPGSGKNPSAVAVLLAGCQQENFATLGAQEFLTVLDSVLWEGKVQEPLRL